MLPLLPSSGDSPGGWRSILGWWMGGICSTSGVSFVHGPYCWTHQITATGGPTMLTATKGTTMLTAAEMTSQLNQTDGPTMLTQSDMTSQVGCE